MYSHRGWMKFLTLRIAAITLSGLAIGATPGHSQSVATTDGVRTVTVSDPSNPFYNSFARASINDSGDVVFTSSLFYGVYSEAGSGLHQVAQLGSPAPGYPGQTLNGFFYGPLIGNADVVAVISTPSGYNVNNSIWTQQGTGSLQLLAGQGKAAPGMPAGITFEGFSTPLMSDQGQVAMLANIQGNGIVRFVNNTGIWAQKTAGGPLELVAASDQSAPGIANSTFKSYSFPAINNAGDVAFIGTVNTSTGTRDGVWADVAGSGLVLKASTQAPVQGLPSSVQLSAITDLVSVNESGKVAFRAELSGPGINVSNDVAYVVETNNGFRIALQEGQAIPGLPSGQVAGSSFLPTVNAAGEITVLASLPAIGNPSTFTNALLTEHGGAGLRTIAYDGEQAPDLPIGVIFSHLAGYYNTNENGVTVFGSDLAGSGVTAGNDYGYFAELAPGLIKTLVREGDMIEIAPSVFKTINGLSTTKYGDQPLNNYNQFAFTATFTDGSSGVFVIAVPEAGTTTLLAIAALAFVAWGIAKRAERREA